MALTADELIDFRADIGDDGTVFTDAELERLYVRAESNYDGAVVLALHQVLVNAAKLHDYRLAQSMESKSQVFDHIYKVLAYREARASSTAAQQVRLTGLRAVPPRNKEVPGA